MEQIRETAFDWTSRDERGYWSSNEPHVINRIKRYAEVRPDEVTIIKEPETNSGYIMALVPKKWMSVKPPRTIDMTEDERRELSQRMKALREKQLMQGNARTNDENG